MTKEHVLRDCRLIGRVIIKVVATKHHPWRHRVDFTAYSSSKVEVVSGCDYSETKSQIQQKRIYGVGERIGSGLIRVDYLLDVYATCIRSPFEAGSVKVAISVRDHCDVLSRKRISTGYQ